jgi:uncharacterized protein YqeY
MSLFRPRSIRAGLVATSRSSGLRYSSTSPSPIVSRLQSDLKDALRAKDEPRKNSVRALQAEITNASKTSKPITTNFDVFWLLRRQMKIARDAIAAAEREKRSDLVAKEESQLAVFQKYLDEIPKVPDSEIDGLIKEAMENLEDGKADIKAVTNRVMKTLAGRPTGWDVVSKKVEQAFASANRR